MRRKEAGCQGGWHPRPRDPGRLRLVVGVLVLVGFWAWPRGCTSLRYGVMDPLDTIHSHHYHTGAEAAADAGGASKSVWPTASSRRAQSHALHVFVTPFEPGVDPGRTALSSDEVSAGEHSNSGAGPRGRDGGAGCPCGSHWTTGIYGRTYAPPVSPTLTYTGTQQLTHTVRQPSPQASDLWPLDGLSQVFTTDLLFCRRSTCAILSNMLLHHQPGFVVDEVLRSRYPQKVSQGFAGMCIRPRAAGGVGSKLVFDECHLRPVSSCS